jgi:hypothetical protein
MSIENIIIASVISKDVFRRFAKVSPKDKEKIVEKVKEKVNGKKKPAKEEVVKDEAVEKVEDKKPAKGEVPPQLKKDKAEDKAEKPDVEKPAVETTVEDEKADEILDMEIEVPDEGDEAPGDDEPSSDMESIVDGIAEEIEQIKSDGQVTPGEVMQLMDNMMGMVDSLLKAKPGRARNSAVAQQIREEEIAGRMVAREFKTKLRG